MRVVLILAGVLLLSAPVAAQPPRVTISAGAASQPERVSFTDVTTFPYFAETARTEGTYRVGDGVAFDIGGGVRLWRSLAAGIAVTRVTRDTDSQVTGTFPHPLYFRTNRTGTWSAGSLDRTETGVHVSAMWHILQRSHVSLSVLGGPSLFRFEQAVVDDVSVIQSYPYDTIDARLTTGHLDGSRIGFHAAVDGGWYFTRHVGLGGIIRFARATKRAVRIGDGEPFDLELGGAQGGGGVRLRF